MNKITREQLKELFIYNPDTGHFLRTSSRGKWKAGERVGGISGVGYRMINCSLGIYTEHRLAWLYMTGQWPVMIDHRNGDKTDNRWSNLRLTDKVLNGANSKKRSHNTNPFKGVKRIGSRWIARVSGTHLGSFSSPEEAHAAYIQGATDLYGDYARTS